MKLVILDRDGVINVDSADFILSPEQWVPVPGSLDAIARLCRAGYRVVVATNQSAVGRGLIDTNTLNRIHARMLQQVHERGGRIDSVFFCPHTPDAGCTCRKPAPGMLDKIAERLNISLLGVPVVGDSLRDLEAALAVAGLPVLVLSGKNELGLKPGASIDEPRYANCPVFRDLSAFADALLAGELDDKTQQCSQDGSPS